MDGTPTFDSVIARLESEAQRRRLTKKALAEIADVHANSLRSFRAYGARMSRPASPWSPTAKVIRKVEAALFPKTGRRVRKSQRSVITPGLQSEHQTTSG